MFMNALDDPLMENNLIQTFIMMYCGAIVNDYPKIHYENPAVNDHSVSFDQFDLLIPLQLNGVFSSSSRIRPTNFGHS